MSIHAALMEQFPVRRSRDEKQRFRDWALAQAREAGWDARVETNGRGKHQNVVIGDPEHAAVVFTAHYDTPANMIVPNLMIPRNLPLYILYQAAVITVIMAIGICAAWLLGPLLPGDLAPSLVFLAVYFGVLLLIARGPANRQNANDNTSGVAAVLELARKIPASQHGKCAFILFDNEESGKLGSKFYAREHTQLQFMRLMVNMDCIGYGDHAVIISRDMARKCTGYELMERMLLETPGLTPHFYDARTSRCNSDQTNFKCGVAVMACRRLPVIGFVTPRIHTRFDTVCREENLHYFITAFADWVAALSEGV